MKQKTIAARVTRYFDSSHAYALKSAIAHQLIDDSNVRICADDALEHDTIMRALDAYDVEHLDVEHIDIY